MSSIEINPPPGQPTEFGSVRTVRDSTAEYVVSGDVRGLLNYRLGWVDERARILVRRVRDALDATGRKADAVRVVLAQAELQFAAEDAVFEDAQAAAREVHRQVTS